MPARAPFPADLERRPFTVAEAIERGVSPRVLEGRRFRTPHRGVRVAAALPETRALQLATTALALPPGAAFTGWTAVELAGLPTPRGDRDPGRGRIAVFVPTGCTPVRLDGVDGVQGLDPRRVRRACGGPEGLSHWKLEPGTLRADLPPLLPPGVRGLRVEHLADVWCALAPSLPRVAGVALGDAVRRDWASQQVLERAVAARDRRPGVVALRELRAAVRYRVDSAMETEVRLLVVDAGLPEPRCGVALWEDDRSLGRVDLVWVEHRVVVEFDGDVHRTSRGQWQLDEAKRRRLRDAGWEVVELVGDDVIHRPSEVVDDVRRALEKGAARRSSS